MPGPEPGLREKVESHLGSIRDGLAKQDHESVIGGLRGLEELSRTGLFPPDHPLMDQSVLENLAELLGSEQYGGDSFRILMNILEPTFGVMEEKPLTGNHPLMRFVFPKLVSTGEIDKPKKSLMLAALAGRLPRSIGSDHPFLGPNLSTALASCEARAGELSGDTKHNLAFIVDRFSQVVAAEKIAELLASEDRGEKFLGRKILEKLCEIQHFTFSPEKALAVLGAAAGKLEAFDRETKGFFAGKIEELLDEDWFYDDPEKALDFLHEAGLNYDSFDPETRGFLSEMFQRLVEKRESSGREFTSQELKNNPGVSVFCPWLLVSLIRERNFASAGKLLSGLQDAFPEHFRGKGFYGLLEQFPDEEKQKLYDSLDKHDFFPDFATSHFEVPLESLREMTPPSRSKGEIEGIQKEIVDHDLGELSISELFPPAIPAPIISGIMIPKSVGEKLEQDPKSLVGKPIGVVKTHIDGGTWMVLYLKEITSDGKAKIVGLCSPGIDWLGEGTGYVRENGRESPISLSPPAAILYKLEKLAEIGAEEELVDGHIDGHVNTYLKIFDALSRLLRKEK